MTCLIASKFGTTWTPTSRSPKRLPAIDAAMVRPFLLSSVTLDYRPKNDDLIVPFDGRRSAVAAELQRGVCRTFRALGHSVVTELALANGRRADVVALSGKGDVLIVEIKPACSTIAPTRNGRIISTIATSSISRCGQISLARSFPKRLG